MRIKRSSQAAIDIVETAEYIAHDNIEAAIRFIDAVDESVEIISKSPNIGVANKIESEPDLRMWAVKGFPKSLIFYRVRTSQIDILRVIHSSRDFTRFFDAE